jgi:hypothetical protein
LRTEDEERLDFVLRKDKRELLMSFPEARSRVNATSFRDITMPQVDGEDMTPTKRAVGLQGQASSCSGAARRRYEQ